MNNSKQNFFSFAQRVRVLIWMVIGVGLKAQWSEKYRWS